MATNVEKMVKDLNTAWNSHDVERIASFYTNDCVCEEVPLGRVWRGKKEIKAFIEESFVPTPDVKFEMKSFFSAGNWVCIESVMTGTHTGDTLGLPVTGKSFSIRCACVMELRKGKISRRSAYWNMLSFLQQVGLMPETLSQ